MLKPEHSLVFATRSPSSEFFVLRSSSESFVLRPRRTVTSRVVLPFPPALQTSNRRTCDFVILPGRRYSAFNANAKSIGFGARSTFSSLKSNLTFLQRIGFRSRSSRNSKCLKLGDGLGAFARSRCKSGFDRASPQRVKKCFKLGDGLGAFAGSRCKSGFDRASPRRARTMVATTAAPDVVSTDGSAASNRAFDEKPLLSEEAASELVPDALVWAALNGLIVGDKNVEKSGLVAGVGVVHAPLSLLPTPIPEEAFNFAVEMSTLFNELVDNVSQDVEFLQATLARTQKTDDFTANLLSILSKITKEGVKQDIRLGLHRSDYMLDIASGDLLQIELNTISSSFAGLGTLVSKMHKYLVGLCAPQVGLSIDRVPTNNASDHFAAGLARAWQEFGNRSAAILMIVQPVERNMYDQQWLTYKLMDLHGIRVLRRTLAEVDSQAKLSANGDLYIGQQAVSVVYYRGGYSPNDYPSNKEWDARFLLERSTAIKCPTISYHLSGAKKIQQELAKEGVLERFVKDEKTVSTLRKSFAGLWALDGDDSEAILEEAINAPSGFVVKPQREGGGNNIYGDDVATKLRELKAEGGDGLAAYIIMQRIFPAVHTSYLLRAGEISPNQTISELGIFGVYLRNGDREIINEHAGHLLRTKVSDSNEGGVAAGFAVLDSPYLT